MRGKALYRVDCTYIYRITPAYAGKRYLFLMHLTKIRDHPRLCGEKEVDDNDLATL